jgi:metallo-beta-lactamase family protein
VQARLRRAGHILGAASVQFDLEGDGTIGHSRLVFSGDLGRSMHPLLLPPDRVDGWHDDDAPLDVVTESTYGDEQHVATDVDAQIAAAVNMACKRGGVVIVPAFAVDRTEVVLWHLDQLVGSAAIPDIPIFVDSPMASRALELYRQEVERGSPEIRPELTGRKLFANLNLVETRSVEESRALGERHGPFVIVSASGMVTGGRVVHHLAQRIGDDRNVVVLAGFQAPGTRGDLLRHGAKTIKMLGQHHPVRAHVVSVDLSTHADQSELLAWLGTAPRPPRMVYVNHGEPDASSALAAAIEARHIPAVVARHGERVRLGG